MAASESGVAPDVASLRAALQKNFNDLAAVVGMQAVAGNVADILQTVEAAGKVQPPEAQQTGAAGNLEPAVPAVGASASSAGT
eukprot:14890788-Alexandrium_andersonii.AAC.1